MAMSSHKGRKNTLFNVISLHSDVSSCKTHTRLLVHNPHIVPSSSVVKCALHSDAQELWAYGDLKGLITGQVVLYGTGYVCYTKLNHLTSVG